ncbi:hypothetical protein EX30DRAFT_340201 [Ascodesmis nigricans]|uniref:BTB domain-containing protein n=1 Tax=Ascodesmis nigricans TaxID=341454 RepID=A0A4S2MYL5_9PEZI|nr:hypothetical protein EX30DRAFT_340201 [Ascodesmis nigricans]
MASASQTTSSVPAPMAAASPHPNTVRTSTPLVSSQPQAPSTSAPAQPQNFPPLASTISKTTGQEPTPLVGPSTTVVGDTLFVFGGRILSRTNPRLTNDMYALDLVTRVWTKLETRGTIPPPRYFHSVCSLGDTKLVCFGGMSPGNSVPQQDTPTPPPTAAPQPPQGLDGQSEVMVMADIHMFDIPSRTWEFIPVMNSPEGRYAHCATIVPSVSAYAGTSSGAPSTTEEANLHGGAELVIVGGQDSANHYIEEINVFNLRSKQWTSKTPLGKCCGAYRSVVAPLGRHLAASKVGAGIEPDEDMAALPTVEEGAPDEHFGGMLIYSNYNFLDVKLELQIRFPNGQLIERPMHGQFSPPGLRFPNGAVLANHFVVSGTFLTSSKQEYALWALNLRTLEWSRVDAGSVFSQGSWNRGILWPRRNAFLILGNKSRSLVEDYNHRRINFSHICMVELEAFGLYENPRRTEHPAMQKWFPTQAQELGLMLLSMREMSDMEFLAIGGERIPVNSRVVAKRWGPYFLELLNASNPSPPPPMAQSNRAVSMATITPLTFSNTSTANPILAPPTTAQFNPLERPRTLFLPHTVQTINTLVKYLYTGSLPPVYSPDCSPQILCSLLQLARPYRIDGLLEVVVERLHQVLDKSNAAAVFNAAAMAAGGGAGVFSSAHSEPVDETLPDDCEHWKGTVSSVIGLQKRGLRGLMEGRRMRERGRSLGAANSVNVPNGAQGTFVANGI